MITRAILRLLLSALIFGLIPASHAAASTVSECRVESSPNQSVSLGFPMAQERLKDKPAPKIMVLPFRLSDRPDYNFGEDAKKDYLAAAEIIAKFSKGKSKPEFVFSPVIDISDTVADMVTLRKYQQMQWQRDESKSTWGFIRRLIALSDPKVDFTGIDSVIMHGSSTSNDSSIAEAMMFSKSPRDTWFRTIRTAEGEILNAVLLDKRTTVNTIAHEIMHNYGLTDLYGSQSGPGQLSMMATNEDSLLSYEKWVLGWVPDSQVQCIIEKSDIDKTKLSTRITIPTSPAEQIVVIKRDRTGLAYIIEVVEKGGFRFLAFYSLDNEARPPITLHTSVMNRPSEAITISNRLGVGTELIAPNYSLLVSNSTSSEITLDLIPKEQLANAKTLFTSAEENRSRIQTELSQVKPSEPVAVKKKKTIVCTKASTVRKVTAIKPKCPAGFKKK